MISNGYVAGVVVPYTTIEAFMLQALDAFNSISQKHRDTIRMCYAIRDTVPTCLELGSASSVIENARPGPAVVDVWVTDICLGVLSDVTSSATFQVSHASARFNAELARTWHTEQSRVKFRRLRSSRFSDIVRCTHLSKHIPWKSSRDTTPF